MDALEKVKQVFESIEGIIASVREILESENHGDGAVVTQEE